MNTATELMNDLIIRFDKDTSQVNSITLYGTELLNESKAGQTDLRGKFHDGVIEKNSDGVFTGVRPGIYTMIQA